MNNKDKTFLCLHTVRLKSNTVELTLLHSIWRPGLFELFNRRENIWKRPTLIWVAPFLPLPSPVLNYFSSICYTERRKTKKGKVQRATLSAIIYNTVRRKIYFALLFRRVHVVQARQKMVLFHFGAFSTINSWADLLPLRKQIEAGIK
jgi:hypothetical protein